LGEKNKKSFASLMQMSIKEVKRDSAPQKYLVLGGV
jgi:hypothetical protein